MGIRGEKTEAQIELFTEYALFTLLANACCVANGSCWMRLSSGSPLWRNPGSNKLRWFACDFSVPCPPGEPQKKFSGSVPRAQPIPQLFCVSSLGSARGSHHFTLGFILKGAGYLVGA